MSCKPVFEWRTPTPNFVPRLSMASAWLRVSVELTNSFVASIHNILYTLSDGN